MENQPESIGTVLANATIPTIKEPVPSDPLEKAQREGWEKWQRLVGRIGERYADCKLSTFVVSDELEIKTKQEKALDLLRVYLNQLEENVQRGRGVVLYGPAGTGKDHLLSAMLRVACRSNLDVEWRNGMDLFADRRDAIDKETPERELIRDLTAPDVLAISDPVPPWGDLSQGQSEFLFRIVDARYRRRKPIWITANFTEGKEAESRISSQVVDRLRDGALAIHCNWPSFRKAMS